MSPELLKTAVIVEDDPQIRHVLAEVFEAAGFSTVSVGNGLDGVRAVTSYQPMVTTLDVNMPGIDGLEAARRIRAQSDTYIIMLTGMESETDVVLGLSAGADEYLVKPFRPRELRARIEAVVRRRQAQPAPTATSPGHPSAAQPQQDAVGPSFPTRAAAPATAYIDDDDQVGRGHPPFSSAHTLHAAPATARPGAAPGTYVLAEQNAPSTNGHGAAGELVPTDGVTWLRHRDLRLSADHHLVAIGERELSLTPTEFDLLAALMQSKRRVRSKSDLTLVLRGESYVTSYFVGEADKRAIEAHMTNLRRKLGDDATTPRYIETVRGVGYRMTSETPSV